MMGQGEMNRVEYQAAKKIIDNRTVKLQQTLAKERGVISLASGLGSPQLIAEKWKTLNLDRQRAIMKSVTERIEVDKVLERGIFFTLRDFGRFGRFNVSRLILI